MQQSWAAVHAVVEMKWNSKMNTHVTLTLLQAHTNTHLAVATLTTTRTQTQTICHCREAHSQQSEAGNEEAALPVPMEGRVYGGGGNIIWTRGLQACVFVLLVAVKSHKVVPPKPRGCLGPVVTVATGLVPAVTCAEAHPTAPLARSPTRHLCVCVALCG